jgi:hemerythrin-like domain-containing protein
MMNVLSEMASKSNERLVNEDVFTILEILKAFADDLHQGKEEGALFPVFMACCSTSEANAVRHMIFEHNQDRSLMEGIEDAVRNSDAGTFAQYTNRLVEILRTHIYKEDSILFELVNKTLTAEDDNKVVAGFENYDRDFQQRGHDELLRRLQGLEWKYLGRVA